LKNRKTGNWPKSKRRKRKTLVKQKKARLRIKKKTWLRPRPKEALKTI
jgi:hypothetical protein